MSKWNLSINSSSCEEVSEQFINLSHLKFDDDVHQKNFWDHTYSPQTQLTLGVPGVENHDEPKFGTNYSSNPYIENLHKESRGKKRELCGEDLVYEFDTNNGSGMTSRSEDDLQQYSKASYVEMHKMSERRRRNRRRRRNQIAKKVKVLEELIPNCNKSNRASVLDQAIQYIQALQHQVQVMSMNSTLLADGRNQIMQSTQYINPCMPIMPKIAFGYYFGFGKSMNYSNMFCSNFSPMMSTRSQFPLLPLAGAGAVGYPSVAALEKRA